MVFQVVMERQYARLIGKSPHKHICNSWKVLRRCTQVDKRVVALMAENQICGAVALILP